jgi:hypothetical protein
MHLGRIQPSRLMLAAVIACAFAGNAAIAVAAKVQHHHNGTHLVGDHLKKDGRYDIDHHRDYTTSVDVQGGKIAALHVRQSGTGNIPVVKYEARKRLGDGGGEHLIYTSFRLAQMQDLGAQWIGYSYVDDDGNEEIYWYPVDEIGDGDTGAIDYVPLNS